MKRDGLTLQETMTVLEKVIRKNSREGIQRTVPGTGIEERPTMDRFLSRLIRHQQASLTVQPYEGHSLEGELSIVVKGSVHTFTTQRGNIGEVVVALENAFVGYDWASGEPAVEVHSGVAEVVSGNVTIVDFDNLASGKCPKCSGDLEFPWDVDARECSCCHYIWAKEDE